MQALYLILVCPPLVGPPGGHRQALLLARGNIGYGEVSPRQSDRLGEDVRGHEVRGK